MIRGINLFICDECKKKFIALDIEYCATAFSVPPHCPKCNSQHTMPIGLGSLFSILSPKWNIYKNIWDNMDKMKKMDKTD